MKLYQNKGSGIIKKSNIISLVLMMVAIITKTFQLTSNFNGSTGLLENNNNSLISNIIFIGCILLIVLINIRVAVEITPTTKHYKIGTPVFVGYVLFAAAVLFVIQGIMDFSGHIIALLDYKNAFDEFLVEQQKVVPFVAFYLPMAVDIMCLFSAISFYLLGMEYVREDEKKHLLLYLVPVIWSILVTVNIIIALPDTVSIHADGSKILLTVLMVGYLYYLSYWACGFEPVKKTLFSMCIRFIFPFVALSISIPYILSMFIGTKDSNVNIPYISICGLAIYGLIVIIQFNTASIHVLNKKASQKNFLSK